MKAFLALLKIDLKLASRNKAVLFFNLLFPLIFFFVFALMFSAKQGSMILVVVTMVLVIGILGNGIVTCAIPATGNVRHLEDNMTAGRGALPDEKTRQRMVAAVAGL